MAARWRTLTEAQRQLWCAAAKTRKTRRRLGQQWPRPGFNYYVQVDVALAHRGLPLADVPPGRSVTALTARFDSLPG